MKNKKYPFFYRFAYRLMRLINPKYDFSGSMPDEPCAYIVHHHNLNGPLNTLMWLPLHLHIWGLSCFFTAEDCYRQYVDYTFTKRFGINRTLAKIYALPASKVVSLLYRQGGHVPVYRGDRKIVETFKISTEVLKKGGSLLICPDINYSDDSDEMGEMYDGFLHLERYYIKETGRHLPFVPIKIDHQKRVITTGETLVFSDGDFKSQKTVMLQELRIRL